MDSAELTEWYAFMRIRPLPEACEDLRAGVLASAVANFGGRDIQKPYRPIDFMPFAEKDDKPVLLETPEQQSALILHAVFGKGG